mgnify:CR=1 FL=1
MVTENAETHTPLFFFARIDSAIIDLAYEAHDRELSDMVLWVSGLS